LAKEVNEKDLNNLQVMVEQMQEAINSKNALEFSNLNLKYHKYFTKLSGNNKLCEIFDNLFAQSDHWTKALGVPGRLKYSLEKYEKFLNISSIQMKGE